MINSLVSVAIVTHNRKREVKKAIQSVFKQSYPSLEVVVVDNGSTDGTSAMIAREFPTVQLVRSPSNKGCPQGRNIAIKHCNGSIICFLDDDAWYEGNFIQRAVAKFSRSPSDLAVIMPEIMEWDSKKWNPRIGINSERQFYMFSGGVSAIKSELFGEIGYFPDTKYGSEEKFMAIKMYQHGKKILFVPDLIVYHKPSNVRNKSHIIFLKVSNDIVWVWTFCPWWFLIPNFGLKIISWIKFGIKHRYPYEALLGLLIGFTYGFINFRFRYKITSRTYLTYLKAKRRAEKN